VHSDIYIPVYGVSSAEETNTTHTSEVSVKQEVDNIHLWYSAITDVPIELPIAMEVNHEPNAYAEYSSIVSPEMEIDTHTSLPMYCFCSLGVIRMSFAYLVGF
jgi:hypothetical protein